jgi:hypothetical protein
VLVFSAGLADIIEEVSYEKLKRNDSTYVVMNLIAD